MYLPRTTALPFKVYSLCLLIIVKSCCVYIDPNENKCLLSRDAPVNDIVVIFSINDWKPLFIENVNSIAKTEILEHLKCFGFILFCS